MTQADEIKRTCHTAGQTHRAASELCVSSTHNYRMESVVYRFADSSGVTITQRRVAYWAVEHKA